ncbi:MAG: hypothetical protein V1779_17235 [bacterium]
MNLKYSNIEAMLTEELNFRYFCYQILWKRELFFGMIFLPLFNITYSMIKGQNLMPYQYVHLVFVPFILLLIAGILIFFTERIFLRRLSTIGRYKIFQRIKYINQISVTLFIMAIVTGIIITKGKPEDFSILNYLQKMGIAFIVVFPGTWLFKWFGGYKTLLSEIERRGLLEKLTIDN